VDIEAIREILLFQLVCFPYNEERRTQSHCCSQLKEDSSVEELHPKKLRRMLYLFSFCDLLVQSSQLM
ncbi:hypothetical protein EJB05_46708, partial [Eragrostis curvula]